MFLSILTDILELILSMQSADLECSGILGKQGFIVFWPWPKVTSFVIPKNYQHKLGWELGHKCSLRKPYSF